MHQVYLMLAPPYGTATDDRRIPTSNVPLANQHFLCVRHPPQDCPYPQSIEDAVSGLRLRLCHTLQLARVVANDPDLQ